MRTNYILSAAALFLLAVFLGVWLCSILLGQSLEPEWSDPPMKVEVSVPAEPEPLPADDPLWTLDNVIVTPHVSGFYHLPETFERIIDIAADNLGRYCRGEELRNIVDFSTGYKR